MFTFILKLDCDHLIYNTDNQAVDENAIPIISSILEIENEETEDTKTHALFILGVFYDSGIQFLDERLAHILVKILQNNYSLGLSEICLEVFYSQADDGTKI